MPLGRGRALRTVAQQVLPPVAQAVLREGRRRLRRAPREWEHVPEGWRALRSDANLRGWDVSSVTEAYRRRWDAYRDAVASTLPLGITPEHVPGAELAHRPYSDLDVLLHNTVMSYAYVLARSARHTSPLSLLDWGGGVGHYYLLSRALVPDVELAYHCKDLSGTVAVGRQLLPEATFYDDDGCFERAYDLVLASGSLHYAQEWQRLVGRLAAASTGYVFVNQLPVVHRVAPFVFVQRPYGHGYATEYLGWCLQRGEFLAVAERHGLRLVREFVNGFKPPVHRAPEPPEYRGFLFAIAG